MEIKIKKEDTTKLASLIYLGNLVINGYKKSKEVKSEYVRLTDDVYRQIIEIVPINTLNYEFKNMPNNKSLDAQIADFRDRISDMIEEDYQDFQDALFVDLISK